MQKAVYPGTFDPITFGHRDVILRAVENLCDHLIIGVTNNPQKNPMFTCAERLQLINSDLQEMGIAERVDVVSFKGLLTNFVREVDARIILRGLRAVSDFEYEFQMASANNKLEPKIETVFLTASEDHHFLASSVVREIATLGGDVGKFVSENVARHIRKKALIECT